jgi:hypothetical protein
MQDAQYLDAEKVAQIIGVAHKTADHFAPKREADS